MKHLSFFQLVAGPSSSLAETGLLSVQFPAYREGKSKSSIRDIVLKVVTWRFHVSVTLGHIPHLMKG